MNNCIELRKDSNKNVMDKMIIMLLRLVLVASLENTSTKFMKIFQNITRVLLKGF